MKSPFSNVNISNPLERDNVVWARCDISGVTKDRTLTLSRNSLRVLDTKGAVEREIQTTLLRGLRLSHRRLLLPLVAGGVLAPLSALGLYEDLISYTLGLIMLFVGIFLAYFGFNGLPVVEIESVDFKEPVFINQTHEALQSFVAFVNYFLPSLQNQGDVHLYALLSETEVGNIADRAPTLESLRDILVDREIILLHTMHHAMQLAPDGQAIEIDPGLLDVPMEVAFRSNDVLGLVVSDVTSTSVTGIRHISHLT